MRITDRNGFVESLFGGLEVEDVDDMTDHVKQLNALLKQLPKYRKAVMSDLFHLFACIVAYQHWNYMNSENVATIFGGMTDIMTSLMTGTQRSRLVRVLIDNFVACFDGVYELETRDDAAAAGAKETKEGIRVYLHDGTFKSLFCQSSEPGKEIQKKAVAKMQQTATLDEASCHLYEIRDAMWRLVGDEEKVLPILKSGSALLITDKLKGDRSEKPAPPSPSTLEVPAGSGAAPSIGEGTKSSSKDSVTSNMSAPKLSASTKSGKKEKKERSPRGNTSTLSSSSTSTSSSVDPPITPRGSGAGSGGLGVSAASNSATHVSLPSSGSSGGLGSLPRPSPRESNTPPLPFGQPLRMLLWVFPHIPAGSVKATEWDQNATVEGFADLACSAAGSSISITTESSDSGDSDASSPKLTFKFSPTHMSAVDDSTRYFVMGTGTVSSSRIGLGFETREEAAKYKSLLQQMMQYDQIHAIDSEPSTPLPSVVAFTSGPLGFDQKMEDGFFETGVVASTGAGASENANSSIAPLKTLAQAALDVKIPEVILVNKNQDVRLQRFVQVAAKLVPPRAEIEERAKTLALFVSNVFGGVDISDGVGTLDDGDSPYASLEGISRDSIFSLRSRTKSNIVKIGNITHGVRRHRSILFKYIADRLEPVLPAALARTIPTSATKAPSYAILVPYPSSAQSYAYIDLVNEPGFSYPFQSTVTTSFATHMHGQLPAAPSPFIHNLQLTHDAASSLLQQTSGEPTFKDIEEIARSHLTRKSIDLSSIPSNSNTTSSNSFARVFEQIGASESGTSRVYRAALGSVVVSLKEVSLAKEGNNAASGAKLPTAEEMSALLSAQEAIEVAPEFESALATTYGYKVDSALGVARVIRECTGLGSLEDQARIAHAKAQPFDDFHIWTLVRDVATGLKVLHDSSKVHGNLSPSNILLDGDQTIQRFNTVKILDPLVTRSKAPFCAHHDKYRSPEVLSDDSFNSASSSSGDIWSLGHIVAELVLDETLNAAQLLTALDDAENEFGSFASFITECCHTDASQRVSAAVVIEKAQSALSTLAAQP